jgi:hypothetical protein
MGYGCVLNSLFIARQLGDDGRVVMLVEVCVEYKNYLNMFTGLELGMW